MIDFPQEGFEKQDPLPSVELQYPARGCRERYAGFQQCEYRADEQILLAQSDCCTRVCPLERAQDDDTTDSRM
jgi:hypothetical protein